MALNTMLENKLPMSGAERGKPKVLAPYFTHFSSLALERLLLPFRPLMREQDAKEKGVVYMKEYVKSCALFAYVSSVFVYKTFRVSSVP